MARIEIVGHLANDDIYPEYDIDAQMLIDKFIGDDTGAPLLGADLTLETDDGHIVTVRISPGDRRQQRRREGASMSITVAHTNRGSVNL